MVTLANIARFVEKGHAVTVIGPSDYHYYSGMGPGMLSKTYRPSNIRFATRHVVEKQGGSFIRDKAESVDPLSRTVHLTTGKTVSYDVVSFNAGSFVPPVEVSGDSGHIFSVKPIESLLAAQLKITELLAEKETAIGIVGGGPSSAEIAGNVWQLAKTHGRNSANIKIFAGKRFMARFPGDVTRRVERSLTKRGIEIVCRGYVEKIEERNIYLDSGISYPSDFIFLALGVKPSLIFSRSGLPVGPDGGLKVNRYLQCISHPEIFGGGDCIFFQDEPLDKVGVYAVRQNPILFHNLLAALNGEELRAFDPGGDYLLIFNLGNGTGVLKKRGIVFGGRPAFVIKNYIDMKFMKRFQAIER
jgi:NADH dehydrogenase FAD-containing subunit